MSLDKEREKLLEYIFKVSKDHEDIVFEVLGITDDLFIKPSIIPITKKDVERIDFLIKQSKSET